MHNSTCVDRCCVFLLQGEDLGPYEMKIEGLQKQISDSLEQCSQMQQFWLRQQNELVRKTRSMDDQTSAIDSLKKQLLILNQKKLRTDGTVMWINRELIFMHSNQRADLYSIHSFSLTSRKWAREKFTSFVLTLNLEFRTLNNS